MPCNLFFLVRAMGVLGLIRGQGFFENIEEFYNLVLADLIPPNALTEKPFVRF